MRFNIRLHGTTGDGKPCQADISVFAASEKQLQEQAREAAKTAAWRGLDGPDDWIQEGSTITVEHVESLDPQEAAKSPLQNKPRRGRTF